MDKLTGSGDSESTIRIFVSKTWKREESMSRAELKTRLQDAIKEMFNISVSIVFIKDKISVNGVEDKIDELEVYLFIAGFIYAIRTQNQKLQLYNPEVI